MRYLNSIQRPERSKTTVLTFSWLCSPRSGVVYVSTDTRSYWYCAVHTQYVGTSDNCAIDTVISGFYPWFTEEKCSSSDVTSIVTTLCCHVRTIQHTDPFSMRRIRSGTFSACVCTTLYETARTIYHATCTSMGHIVTPIQNAHRRRKFGRAFMPIVYSQYQYNTPVLLPCIVRTCTPSRNDLKLKTSNT